MYLRKECNTCAQRHCTEKMAKKITGHFTRCSQYLTPQPLKAKLIDIAIVHEMTEYGKVSNASRLRS